MSLDLANYEQKAREAVMAFWGNRDKARQKQIEAGTIDQGERAGVTAGKNMDGFIAMVKDIIIANGLSHASIHTNRSVVTLPGYFRPTKMWDLLVIDRGRLVAAIELKSQVGPSYGNNYNNRTEEAIGTAKDLWIAYREGAFGRQAPPFLGWLMLVEDEERSATPVRDASPHFAVDTVFANASYQRRYEILCDRLTQEKLYTSAALMTSPRSACETGAYSSLSDFTSLTNFVTSLAGHIASEAARPF